MGVRKRATKEFFKYIVGNKNGDWNCEEFKKKRLEKKLPNLIRLLRGGPNG